ncbi:unnamed protein product [Caenorhabditis angaria]|uniref:Uncharacterized protein n=1 Tax=Caenorhabditis angaria TaxID=860376 RepID=A0A9P1N4C3_9PELO|nr:unnamed protein product [Caenorhabditis angaria]
MASLVFRLRQLVIVGVLLVAGYFLVLSLGFENTPSEFVNSNRISEEDSNPVKTIILHSDKDIGASKTKSSKNLELNQACNIPKLDINGTEVIGFFKTPAPLKCQRKNSRIEDNWVFVDMDGKLRFTEKRKQASCKIKYLWRKNDEENRFSDDVQIFDGFQMNGSDYATVKCIKGFEKWNSVLWDVNKIAEVEERAKNVSRNPEEKSLNVYFLGFDSLSQMSYRRKLPNTVKFLEETMESVVLNGYNIVGDGTPQAYIPILTAQTEVELPLTRKRYSNANYVDDVYPFIWKNFSDSGYATMYAEDAFNIGTFTYRLKGFRNQPTDHYTRTVFKELEKNPDWNCVGSIPLHRMWFQNARKFMKVYSDIPRFLMMHQSLLSHDDVNLVQVEDEDLTAHLKQMKEEGLFDDSVVILMADHGHRFAKLRETHQGQLEERMPFFSISLPKSLKNTEKGKKMWRNLKENKEKLTSPFDIHASLMDILNLSKIDENEFEIEQDAKNQRSLSIFRKIPEKRNCENAGIEAHWCTCLLWKNALENENDRKLSERLAKGIVKAINQELEPEIKLCAPLKLAQILSSKKLLPDSGVLAYKNVKDNDGFVPDLSGNTHAAFAHYQLKIRTTPGVAIYEATIFYDMLKDEMKLDFASISHVNKFGNTPHCIIDRNYYLATFCVCYDRI